MAAAADEVGADDADRVAGPALVRSTSRRRRRSRRCQQVAVASLCAHQRSDSRREEIAADCTIHGRKCQTSFDPDDPCIINHV